MVLKAIYWKSK